MDRQMQIKVHTPKAAYQYHAEIMKIPIVLFLCDRKHLLHFQLRTFAGILPGQQWSTWLVCSDKLSSSKFGRQPPSCSQPLFSSWTMNPTYLKCWDTHCGSIEKRLKWKPRYVFHYITEKFTSLANISLWGYYFHTYIPQFFLPSGGVDHASF